MRSTDQRTEPGCQPLSLSAGSPLRANFACSAHGVTSVLGCSKVNYRAAQNGSIMPTNHLFDSCLTGNGIKLRDDIPLPTPSAMNNSIESVHLGEAGLILSWTPPTPTIHPSTSFSSFLSLCYTPHLSHNKGYNYLHTICLWQPCKRWDVGRDCDLIFISGCSILWVTSWAWFHRVI